MPRSPLPPTCWTPFDGHAAGVAPRTAAGPVSSTRTDVRGPRPADPGLTDGRIDRWGAPGGLVTCAAPDPGAGGRSRADQVRRRRRRGRAGPGADHDQGGGHQDVGRRGHRGPAARHRDRDRGLAGCVPTRRGGRGAGVQPAERAHGDGHRAGRRDRDCLRRAARAAGGPAHPQRGQGGRNRQRAGRQGSGHGDGDPPAPGHRPAAPGRRRRRAGAGHLSYLAWRRRGAAPGRPDWPRRERVMIAHLRGTVAGVAPDGAVIEVGGVGMRVQCTPGTLATLRPGESAQVATSLVVREDSLTLYGFVSDDERNVFELLQTASGVGPRLALAMLAVHAPDALRRAVSTEDLKALTMVPGIGQKGAQRIVLELKDRLGPPGDDGAGLPGRPAPRAPSWRDQVQSGLVNLGWPARDADLAIAALEDEGVIGGSDGDAVNVATVLRAALRKLSKQ